MIEEFAVNIIYGFDHLLKNPFPALWLMGCGGLIYWRLTSSRGFTKV